MVRWVLVLVAFAACRSREPARQQSAITGDAMRVDAPGVTKAMARGGRWSVAGWTNRCLGEPSRIAWEPQQRAAAVAASTVALGGRAAAPTVDIPSYAPQRQFEIDWTVARVGLAMGRADAAAIDRAFASASAIGDESKRDRALLWGAIELGDHGRTDAAKRWSAALRDEDYPPEHAAHEVRRLAERGDVAGARRALASLPPSWGIRSDIEWWHDYPRWYGSAGAAACVALATPAGVQSPDARALVEDAERMTANVDEEWRQNRELRAVALAWGRIGDLERALVVASRMPGSERADALVELIDLFGGDTKLPLDKIDGLARQALAATKSAPLVLGSTDRVEMEDFIAQVGEGVVVAAVARQQMARGDVNAAAVAIATIPENLSVRHEADLQLECARLRNSRDGNIAAVLTGVLADDNFRPNLIAAAADVGCMPIVMALLHGNRIEGRIADNVTRRLLYRRQLDDAIALLRAEWDVMDMVDRTERLDELLTALAGDGRGLEGSALFQRLPPETADLIEERALVAGYRLVVALAVDGELAEATVLSHALEPRLNARR